jgi:hypothetical protein
MRDILGQRHREVEAQGEIAVALLEAVDLLFGLAAALGQQHLGRLDDGGVERGEAVERVGVAQGLHPAPSGAARRQQLHEAGQRPGLDLFHVYLNPFV